MTKSAKIWLSKSIFYIKNHRNLSLFFSLKNTNLWAHFFIDIFWYPHFLNHFISKMMPDFWYLATAPISKFNNLLWICWSYAKKFPSLENSTTRIIITYMIKVLFRDKQVLTSRDRRCTSVTSHHAHAHPPTRVVLDLEPQQPPEIMIGIVQE